MSILLQSLPLRKIRVDLALPAHLSVPLSAGENGTAAPFQAAQ